MFCPECGSELISPNQKFCHNCGTDTRVTAKSSNYKIEQFQNEPASKTYYVPINPKIELQRGPPGRYSNISFWFALASIILGIASFYIGSYLGFPMLYYNYVEYDIGLQLGLFFIILSIRAGGLILGIISRISNSKAIELEPNNDLEKAGSIIGIFGIIVNAVGLVFSIITPISLLRAVPDYYD